MSHSLSDVRRAAVRAQVMLVMPSPPSKGGARVGEASQSQSQFRPDVCFRFGQVGVATGAVDWVGTCGNVSSAVARFAGEEGLGTPLPEHAGGASRMTRVRMLCQNTGAYSAEEEREAEHRVHVEQAAAFLKTQLAPGGFALFGLDWLSTFGGHSGADGVKIFEDAMPPDFSYKLYRDFCAECGEWVVVHRAPAGVNGTVDGPWTGRQRTGRQ